VIKIEANKELPVQDSATPSESKSGRWVLAIGSPFGLQATVKTDANR